MLSFFLRIMKQKCGSYVCVQLLQTLNILFENIRNETSLCKLSLIKLNSDFFEYAFELTYHTLKIPTSFESIHNRIFSKILMFL